MAAGNPRFPSTPRPLTQHYFNLRLGRWLTAEAGGLGVAGAVVVALVVAAGIILFRA